MEKETKFEHLIDAAQNYANGIAQFETNKIYSIDDFYNGGLYVIEEIRKVISNCDNQSEALENIKKRMIQLEYNKNVTNEKFQIIFDQFTMSGGKTMNDLMKFMDDNSNCELSYDELKKFFYWVKKKYNNAL